jgi:hypothetical protein
MRFRKFLLLARRCLDVCRCSDLQLSLILTVDGQRVSLHDRREILFDLAKIIIVLAIVMPVANSSYPTDYNQHKNIKERE